MSVYTASLLAIVFFTVLAAALYSRASGDAMEYMALVMAFSMSFAFSVGCFAGMMLKQNLFESSLLSILSGGIAGLTIGNRFYFFSALEGLFSGIMAGLMGAMTVAMLPMHDAHKMLLISILLTISISTLCIIQFLEEQLTAWLERYFVIFVLFGMLLLFVVFLTFPDPPPAVLSPSHH